MTLDKTELLNKLEVLKAEKEGEHSEAAMQRMSFAAALPALTEIDHEKEYALCLQVAKRLMGKLREPEPVELE